MAWTTKKVRFLAQYLYARQSLGKIWGARTENGIINIQVDHVSLDSTSVKVHPDGTGALKKTVRKPLENQEPDGQLKFIW